MQVRHMVFVADQMHGEASNKKSRGGENREQKPRVSGVINCGHQGPVRGP